MSGEQDSAQSAAGGLKFLDGGGAMGGLIRARDWSDSPVGPPDAWSSMLKSTVAMMLPAAAQIVLFWGPEFVALYNDNYAPTIGDKHPRALGRPAQENWSELWDDLEPLLTKVFHDGETVSAADRPFYIERGKTGETVYFDISYSPVRAEDGSICGVLCLVKETTGKVNAERDLREREQRFHDLADSIDQMIWATQPDGFHDYYNRRWYEYTGVPDGSTDGEGWANMFHPDDQERTWAVWRHSLETGEPYHIEYRLRHRSGVYRWVLGRAQPVRGPDGAIARWYGTCTDIHELKLAQEQVRESEERLHFALAGGGGIGTWDWDIPGNLVYADERFAELYSVDPAEAAAGAPIQHFFAGIHPQDIQAAREAIEAAMASGAPFSTEYRVVKRDGSVRWVLARGRCHLDSAGEPVRFPGVVLDITDAKNADAILRESEERYRLARRATNDAIWDWDLAQDQVLWNEALETAYGHKLSDVGSGGDWWIEHIHPDDRARVDHEIHAVIDGKGEVWTGEYRFRRADGSYASVLDRGTVVRDEHGRAIRMIGAMLDVSKAREAEAAIRVSEDRLRLAADATQIGIWDFDLVAGRLEWDDQVRAGFGLSPDAPIDYGVFLKGLHTEDRAAADEGVQRALEPGGPGGYDVEYRTIGVEDGKERWIAARGRTQFEDGKAVRFVGTTLDITSRKQAAAALARSEADLRLLNETLEQRVALEVERRGEAEEALRQAQKMETLGQLTGGVAHDFNNLLQIVSGNIGLIQRGLPEQDARLRRAADNAARGAERAAVLTQRLLAFSRRQPLAPKPIDPNKMVGGMSDLLHRTLGEMVEVETVLAPRLWTIEADPNQLENAILNLAINARDAMPDGGKLTIETCNTHLDRAYVTQNAEVTVGQYVCICVTDSGAGMDEETVARAFEPFFTTKEVGKGTGLGLSMVYGFVKQSGGHLKIYSERGEGTTVKIYLPRLIGEQPLPEDGDEELIPEGGQNETILVCEDDADVRAFTVEVLRELGYRVLEAEDGPSTLALLDRVGEIDLLFTDVVLPNGMTGAVLAREALARRPALKVLYTTGYARNAIVHHGRLDPGVELITKPFSYADLAARVRDVLDGQP